MCIYFLLNNITRHQDQDSSIVFVKKNKTKIPKTIDELQEHLQNLPTSRIVNKLMRFSTVLRGTLAYWRNFC